MEKYDGTVESKMKTVVTNGEKNENLMGCLDNSELLKEFLNEKLEMRRGKAIPETNI